MVLRMLLPAATDGVANCCTCETNCQKALAAAAVQLLAKCSVGHPYCTPWVTWSSSAFAAVSFSAQPESKAQVALFDNADVREG